MLHHILPGAAVIAWYCREPIVRGLSGGRKVRRAMPSSAANGKLGAGRQNHSSGPARCSARPALVRAEMTVRVAWLADHTGIVATGGQHERDIALAQQGGF